MDKEQIFYGDFPLFTKICTVTPTLQPLELPSEACYAYIVNGNDQILGDRSPIRAIPGSVILSLCGLTLGRMLSRLSDGELYTVIVHLDRELLRRVFNGEKPKLWQELQRPVTEYVVQNAANNLISSYFDQIIDVFSNRAAVTESFLEVKLREIILLLLQTENSADIRTIVNSLFSERVFSFRELIDAHIDTADTMAELAILTNCSLSTFKRKFRQAYATTPARYKTRRRAERVAELLRVSDKLVSEIGYECGFSTPSHLTRAFKRRFGVTPTDYRLSLPDH